MFGASSSPHTFCTPPYHGPSVKEAAKWSVTKRGLSDASASDHSAVHLVRSHSGTLALKTEDFSTKIGRFSKTQKWIY